MRRLRSALAASLCLAVGGGVLAAGVSVGDELFIGVWSPFGSRWEAEADVCIWGDGAFRVIAASVERGDTFALSNGAGDRVAYRVFWRRRDAPGRGQELEATVPSQHSVAGDPRFECGGQANSRIRVRVDSGEIDRAPPGIYGDTLMLMLSPL